MLPWLSGIGIIAVVCLVGSFNGDQDEPGRVTKWIGAFALFALPDTVWGLLSGRWQS